MNTIDPESPPRPCDYFDMIGGTSTGGLIAIMLGRLGLTVDQCINCFTSISKKVFEKKKPRVRINGQIQGRFDSERLKDAVIDTLQSYNFDKDELLKNLDGSCKV